MSAYLTFENISMEFPGVKALDQMSFSADKGEVVAFLGENGAGKSTLLKILNGDYHPTKGRVRIGGREVSFSSPNDAIAAGVSVIYQERQLASFLSIAENIFIGNMPKKGILIDFGELNRKAKAIIEEFGLSVSPAERVKDISVANKEYFYHLDYILS